MKNNTVTVIGAGYVGLTTAALLANSGLKTYVIDTEPTKIRTIKKGRSPFFEPGLDELIKKAVAEKLLHPTTDYQQAVPHSQIIFCCVGTPDKADGSTNLSYVYAALETAARLAQNGTVFIQKSTVPVGTGKKAMALVKKTAPKLKFAYVSNPEFLREGSAIADTLYPDRTVLGGPDKEALRTVAGVYKALNKAAPNLDPVFQNEYQKTEHKSGSVIFTTLESAELIKITANAFLALKISFANSIAKLADSVAADVNEVMDGIGKDGRIGRAFLNAGRGYGGGCFPKDVSGLIATAAEHNVDMEIMSAAVHVNSSMPEYIIAKIEAAMGTLKAKKVAVLGLSFKSATSDTRRSPGIAIANLLVDKGAVVTAYDPKAIIEGDDLKAKVSRKKSLPEAIKKADIVLITTDWPEFLSHDLEEFKKLMSGSLLADCMNAFDAQAVTAAGLSYVGVGR